MLILHGNVIAKVSSFTFSEYSLFSFTRTRVCVVCSVCVCLAVTNYRNTKQKWANCMSWRIAAVRASLTGVRNAALFAFTLNRRWKKLIWAWFITVVVLTRVINLSENKREQHILIFSIHLGWISLLLEPGLAQFEEAVTPLTFQHCVEITINSFIHLFIICRLFP